MALDDLKKFSEKIADPDFAILHDKDRVSISGSLF
jgi:hypothetical protein